MDDTARYRDAVAHLAACHYTVQALGVGYLVLHTIDRADISFARNLDDLVDLADLMEWAAKRSPDAFCVDLA